MDDKKICCHYLTFLTFWYHFSLILHTPLLSSSWPWKSYCHYLIPYWSGSQNETIKKRCSTGTKYILVKKICLKKKNPHCAAAVGTTPSKSGETCGWQCKSRTFTASCHSCGTRATETRSQTIHSGFFFLVILLKLKKKTKFPSCVPEKKIFSQQQKKQKPKTKQIQDKNKKINEQFLFFCSFVVFKKIKKKTNLLPDLELKKLLWILITQFIPHHRNLSLIVQVFLYSQNKM